MYSNHTHAVVLIKVKISFLFPSIPKMLIVRQRQKNTLDVPNTIVKLLENDEEGVHLGSYQHISSEFLPYPRSTNGIC